ncbi:glycosyltransferase family 4 protein [Glutamicibacter nicotianae]|uniref:glycosyltransferase family 4 protein n=1 Tax=Glutamicibacter nicotianae TaxID=37929 RepID=UPI0025528B7C|nr:glycosyltransferase family 4 protein [Glutamicibacter nicotianae]WIV45286.1 glycosyltransferase family 4 protein [Glutamicibacter nicotianae]
MKILIVSQYYSPEAVPIPGDLAHGLAARGHTVRVVTGFPNYPYGRVLDGYKQRWRQVEQDGLVGLTRVPLYTDHSQSAVKRMLNYISFALSSSTARGAMRDADVIYVYATQMTAAFGPWLWRLAGGRPYVLHVQDLWPDSIVGSSMLTGNVTGRIINRILSPWLRSVYSRASAVIGIAPTMVATLNLRGSNRPGAQLIYNWADSGNTAAREALSPVDRPRAKLVYAGNVGDMQDLHTVVRAAHKTIDDGVVLTIVGDGVVRESLGLLVRELGAKNVHFSEPVPREKMPEVYAEADYALVTLKDLPVFRGTIPSKFQASLAAGLPVISTVQGDVRSIVDEMQVGFTSDAENVDALADIFRSAAKLSTDDRILMAQRGKVLYDSEFSKKSGISKIEDILSEAVKGQRITR